jgi:hypothetical protein
MKRALAVAALLAAAALVRPAPPPAVEAAGLPAAAVACGGLNGLVVDYLWLHASQQQDEGRYFELVQTTEWIAALQPRLGGLYDFQAFNLASNLADSFSEPADRWRWVEHGLLLLSDTGRRRDPGDPLVYQALAALLLDRLAQPREDVGEYYRQQFAAAWPRLSPIDAAERAAVEADVGPLDWRAAASHAYYWATLASRAARGPRGALAFRYRYAALRTAAADGRVVTDGAVFLTAPEPRLIPAAERLYERLTQQYPDDGGLRAGRENFRLEAIALLTACGAQDQARARLRTGESLESGLAAARRELGGEDGSDGLARSLLTRAWLARALGESDLGDGLERLAGIVTSATTTPPPGLRAATRAVAAAQPLSPAARARLEALP